MGRRGSYYIYYSHCGHVMPIVLNRTKIGNKFDVILF